MNELLEGTWKTKINNSLYTLYLPGPNTGNGRYSLGEHFYISQSKTNEDGSGISSRISGTFTCEENHLHFNCIHIEIEGWGPDDEEEMNEEPCVQEYKGEDLDGDLDLSGDEPLIRMNAFDADIELKKVR